MTQAKIVLVIACALIDPDGRVLLAQRPAGKNLAGLWEFPGGKMEPGERPEETLIRELREELGIEVKEPCLAPFSFASHSYADFHLLMPLYVCRRWEGTLRALEHEAIKWLKPKDMAQLPLTPADVPLVPMLRDLL
jgi:8-oxo-dGTP diphosphatase